MMHLRSALGVSLLCVLALTAQAGTPTAVINASPITGNAPLGVFFDASNSTAGVATYVWDFGDGAASNAKTVTHIYTVAGTYIAKLTVTDPDGNVGSSEITITVLGNGEGPLTPKTNFRWATTSAKFTLQHGRLNRDQFILNAAFNTVDLPESLQGIAASFSINNSFTVSGILNDSGGFESPDNLRPDFSITVSPKEQILAVFIAKANLAQALALSGANNETVGAPGRFLPLTFTLTIGAQTYTVTENFRYTSTVNAGGRGEYVLKDGSASVNDGFFVVSRASALENLEGDGHYFEFELFLARPNGADIKAPTSGTWVFQFNDLDKLVIPFDRIKTNGSKVTYDQSDRDLNGISRFIVDVVTRKMTIRTWDLPWKEDTGGTGLPIRGRPFTAFNFALRMELDLPDGTKFQVVTATRMTRRTADDAFWQTGRRKKRQ